MSDKKTFQDLVEMMARLRGPEGCPWDREQTIASLGPMLIEEAWEVVEAADRQQWPDLRDELGDLLFQIIFYARIASEEHDFDIDDAITRVYEKMYRRHPHVFGDASVSSTAEVLANWEAIKAAERGADQESSEKKQSLLDGVPSRLPALLEAYQLTTRAARVGFDWRSLEDVFAKMTEEIGELTAEIERDPRDPALVASEVGDLLFVLVNVARKLGVEPEVALKATNRKFRRRFSHVEERVNAQGKILADSTLEEMDAYWDEAKQIERQLP